MQKFSRFETFIRNFWTVLGAQNLFSRHFKTNYVTLAELLGINRVVQKCRTKLKVLAYSLKCLGLLFGLLFDKFGLLSHLTVWSHCRPLCLLTFRLIELNVALISIFENLSHFTFMPL